MTHRQIEFCYLAFMATCATLALWSIWHPAIAEPVVLTPTKLYDLIEELQKRCDKLEERNSKTLKVLLSNNQRVQALEKELQRTHDQVAHIVKMLRAKGAK